MSLKEEIKTLTGNKRKFFLLRVVDMDKTTALKLCNVKVGTYNNWCQNTEFTTLYRQRTEFAGEYKQEAIQLLRRDNQLAAVLLEAKIIEKMKGEIDDGIYELVRTNLAKEVYSKLIAELDVVPKEQSLTWQQQIDQINIIPSTPALPVEVIEGEVINATDNETRPD